MAERILFLTGHLAHARLEKVLNEAGGFGFDCTVVDIGVRSAIAGGSLSCCNAASLSVAVFTSPWSLSAWPWYVALSRPGSAAVPVMLYGFWLGS